MTVKANKTLLSFFLIWLLSACNQVGETVFMKPVDGSWPKNKPLTFDLEIKDATISKNIIFVIRNNNEYPYSNLWLISKFSNEKNKRTKVDSLNFILANSDGSWIGSGFGDTKETLFQYKLNYKFPANGKYKISVSHGMRRDTLAGIEDFGIKLENVKP